jgi:hypothetical protein
LRWSVLGLAGVARPAWSDATIVASSSAARVISAADSPSGATSGAAAGAGRVTRWIGRR